MRKLIIIVGTALFLCTNALAQTVAEDSVVVAMPDSTESSPRLIPSVKKKHLKKAAKDTLTLKASREYTDEYLDTVKVAKKFSINDYTMVGFQYGYTLSQMMFNPTKRQGMLMNPYNFGVTFTKYGKMFGYMPYFGFQTGLFYGQSGYKFKKDKETGNFTETVDGAVQARYTYGEIPFLAHLHMDVWHLKFIVNAGLFGGYRFSIEREGEKVPEKYKTAFYDYEKRFEYGVKAGVGFGFVFDPIEFHIEATYRYSMGSLYKPDYNSEYYYRFAYPSDIIITAGLHFQLTRRTGKTKSQLRKEARQLVYETKQKNL